MRKRTHPPGTKAEMEMTAMIDVTFLLLIFFMCTLKFKTLEGKLSAYLPKDVGVTVAPADRVEDIDLSVHVAAAGTRLDATGQPWTAASAGRYHFGPDRHLSYSLGPRRGLDFAAVSQHLTNLQQADPERQVALAPDSGVVHAEVVELLDLLLDVGFIEVRLQGAPGPR